MLDSKQPYVDMYLIYRLIDYIVTNVIVILIMAYAIPYQFVVYLLFVTLAIVGLTIHDNKHSLGKTCLYYLEDDFSNGKDKRYKYVKLLRMSIRVLLKYLPLLLVAVFGKRLSITTYVGFTASFMVFNYLWCLITVGDMVHDTVAHTHVFLTEKKFMDLKKQPKPRYKAKNKDKNSNPNTVSRISLKAIKSILDKENVRNPQDFIVQVNKEEIERKKKEKTKKKKEKKKDSTESKEDVLLSDI